MKTSINAKVGLLLLVAILLAPYGLSCTPPIAPSVTSPVWVTVSAEETGRIAPVQAVTPTGLPSPQATPLQVMPTPSVPGPTVTATPTVQTLPTDTEGSLIFDEHPLSDLSPDAQEFLDGRVGRWGVAVIVPSRGITYTTNADQLMSMASVVKVVVMLATMDRALTEKRDLTSWELQQLWPMITESNNDATTTLWNYLGGGNAIEEYIRAIGITDIVPNSADYWGASRASAKAVALLFAQIAFSDMLDQPNRQLALELLSAVIPSQRWGVTAGVPDELPAGTVIGLKDGWYPAGYAWWVNSAGVLMPGDNRPAYAIAILTRGQPSWEYGIDTIEGAAEKIHTALHGRP